MLRKEQQQPHPTPSQERVNRNKVKTRSAHDEAIIVGVHEAEFQIIDDGGVV